MKNKRKQLAPARLTLLSAKYHAGLPHCQVCGGQRINEGEFKLPDGAVSMDVDADLCLECAILFWRAFKHANPHNYKTLIIELLRFYPVTQDAVERDSPLLTEKPQ